MHLVTDSIEFEGEVDAHEWVDEQLTGCGPLGELSVSDASGDGGRDLAVHNAGCGGCGGGSVGDRLHAFARSLVRLALTKSGPSKRLLRRWGLEVVVPMSGP